MLIIQYAISLWIIYLVPLLGILGMLILTTLELSNLEFFKTMDDSILRKVAYIPVINLVIFVILSVGIISGNIANILTCMLNNNDRWL